MGQMETGIISPLVSQGNQVEEEKVRQKVNPQFLM